MLRLATPDYLRFCQATEFTATFGGGEANVAVSLANYGLKPEFVTRVPKNDIAESCLKELHKYGVGTSHVVYGGDRLGIYFPRNGAVARPSKVVYDRAYSAIAEIKPGMIDWEQVLAGADWFHWTGITPALSQGAADVCLEAIKAANKMGITVSTDLNFRKNLWKYGKTASEVMPALVEGCDVILGNEEDAEKVFGIKPEGFDVTATGGKVQAAEFESVCKQLMQRFPRGQKGDHHAARFDQREPQYLGGCALGRQTAFPVAFVRHYAHRGPCGRWRLVYGRPDLRSAHLYGRRPEGA